MHNIETTKWGLADFAVDSVDKEATRDVSVCSVSVGLPSR